MLSNRLTDLLLLICLVCDPVLSDGMKVAMISVHSNPLVALEGLGAAGKGGQNMYVWELSRHLAELDYNLTTFTRSEYSNQTGTIFLSDNNRVTFIEAGPQTFLNNQLIYPHVADFSARIDKSEFDLVISNYWLSGLVGLTLGLPQIHVHHSHGLEKYSWVPDRGEGRSRIEVERRINAEADCVVHQYQGEYRLTNATNYRLIKPGINTEEYENLAEKETVQRKLQISSNVINVLYVGRFVPQKGIPYALEALNKTSHQVAVRLIGGYKDQPLEYLVDMYPHFHFLGPLPHNVVLEYMAASDILIIPSLYEPFGLVAVEAIAAGCCVLCSSIGGIDETVVEGVNGFKFQPKDSDAILGAFERLANDPGLMTEMSRRNKRTGRRNYSWRKTAKQFDHAIKDIISSGSSKEPQNFPLTLKQEL